MCIGGGGAGYWIVFGIEHHGITGALETSTVSRRVHALLLAGTTPVRSGRTAHLDHGSGSVTDGSPEASRVRVEGDCDTNRRLRGAGCSDTRQVYGSITRGANDLTVLGVIRQRLLCATVVMQVVNPLCLTQEQTAVSRERSYARGVLLLKDDETEEVLDERVLLAAKELGIEIMGLLSVSSPQKGKPESTHTFSLEAPPRSPSIDSKQSQSTGFVSTFSEVSREQRNGRRPSAASLSFRDYDSFLSRGRSDGRHMISFSPPSTPSKSTFSLPLYSPSPSPKKSLRHLRGLSMLKLRRTDSAAFLAGGCPHCPRDMFSRNRAQHLMPCGHRLCTPALRETIQAATACKSGGVPTCCGIPIPGAVIEHVVTQEEQDTMLGKLEQWDGAAQIAEENGSDVQPAITTTRPGLGSRAISVASKVDSVVPDHIADLTKELPAKPGSQVLQNEQNELNTRFHAWIEEHRTTLQTTHERLRTEMKSRHEAATEALIEHHADAMVEAEDKQVSAEADMRDAHAKEKRDHATALKHMIAYCAGTLSSGELHNRVVTEQDQVELTKARWVSDTMATKHESAINVLRAEQARRLRMRGERQEREVQVLRQGQRREELEAERGWREQGEAFEVFVEGKGRRIGKRWELQVAVFGKRSEVVEVVLEDEKAVGGEEDVLAGAEHVEHAEQDLTALAKMREMYLGATAEVDG